MTQIYVPVVANDRFIGAIKHYHDVTYEIALYRYYFRLISFFGVSAVTLISGLIVLQLKRSGRQRESDLTMINEMQSKAIANETKRVRESRLLSELNEWLQSCRSLEELYDMVGTFMAKLLPNTAGSLFIYANSRDVLDGVKGWNKAGPLEPMHPDDCWGLRRGRNYTYGTNEIDFVCSHVATPTLFEYACLPIVAHGETIGLLHFVFRQAAPCEPGSDRDCVSCNVLCEDDRRLAFICAEHISLAIANVRLREQLRDQSIRDPLTGLFNRRYMIETSRREIARAQRAGELLSMLSIDVDHFKRFNDNHGHDCGDVVLRAVSDCLVANLREDDIACRHGGEEFVVVLPGITTENATKRADDLRDKIEKIVVRYADANLPRITISIGVASYPEHGTTTQRTTRSMSPRRTAGIRSGWRRVM